MIPPGEAAAVRQAALVRARRAAGAEPQIRRTYSGAEFHLPGH